MFVQPSRVCNPAIPGNHHEPVSGMHCLRRTRDGYKPIQRDHEELMTNVNIVRPVAAVSHVHTVGVASRVSLIIGHTM